MVCLRSIATGECEVRVLVLHLKFTYMSLLRPSSEYVVSLVISVMFEELFSHDYLLFINASHIILNSLKAIDVIVSYDI